jgi:nitroreductase
VDRYTLTKIFETATWAPTHRMTEPWQIKIYEGEAKHDFASLIIESYIRSGYASNGKEEKTRKMMEGVKKFITDIPHHALIYMDKNADQRMYEEDYAAVCAFIQNAQLVAWEYQVGILWTVNPYLYDPVFTSAVGLDDEKHKLVAVLQIGYPERIPQKRKRTPISQKIEWVKRKTER